MNSENENFDEGISLSQLLDFTKKNWLKTTLRIVISLFFTLVLFALLYALLPSQKVFTRNIGLKLQKKGETFIYPSGKDYVDADLISQVVLRKVYEKNNLENRVDFQDFAESFYISDFTLEQAAVEAAYRAGLARKNLQVADIQNLKLQYESDMAKIPRNWRSVSMKKLFPLTKVEQVKIINEVPAVWFEIYSQLESVSLPQIPVLNRIADLKNRHQGTLATLEISRSYILRLSALAADLDKLSDGREIKLKSGESLSELQNQISLLSDYQLPLLYQYFYSTAVLKSRLDHLFIRGRLDALDRELTYNKVQQTSIEKALDVVAPLQSMTGSGNGRSKAENTGNLQIDNSFLLYLAQMIKNDYTNVIRGKIGSELLENKKVIARLETEKFYHERLEKNYLTQKNAVSNDSIKEFNVLFEQFLKDLASSTLKLSSMRDLLNSDYMANRTFYVSNGSVLFHKSSLVPPVKLLLGLFALFAIYNAAALVLDFNKFVSAKQD